MIKTVIFDLGNVIVFFDFEKIISQIAALSGLSAQKIQELLIEKELHKSYESGKISSEEIFEIFAEKAPKLLTAQEFFYAASDIFRPNHEIFPLIESLKAGGVRLVLLSNTNPAHYQFLTPLLPILSLFDVKILSYEVGAIKPDPKIYRAALEAAHCLPQECFYTDDIPEYIAAAKTHGIHAELFTDAPTLRNSLTKHQLEYLA